MAASPLPAARKFTRPQPGDTWERIASRELADTPVEEAVGMLQSWNFGNALPDAELHVPMGLPLFHVGGATAWGAMPFLWGHTITMVGAEGFRNPNAIRDFFGNAERLKWTLVPVVPAIWSMRRVTRWARFAPSRCVFPQVACAPLP